MKAAGVLFIIVGLAFIGIYGLQDILFNKDCGGHLMLAAHANNPDLAGAELDKAMDYLEANAMTQGFTSVVYRTPDEDVGYWYSNLKAARDSVKSVKGSDDPLEKSNVLLKLHETLQQPVPAGLPWYPHNAGWGMLCILGLVFILGGVVTFMAIF